MGSDSALSLYLATRRVVANEVRHPSLLVGRGPQNAAGHGSHRENRSLINSETIRRKNSPDHSRPSSRFDAADTCCADHILSGEQQYPSIFPVPANSSSPSSPTPFSLQDFQIQGSRILSRGFSVSRIASGRKPPRPETSSSRHKHRLNNQEGDGDVSMESVNSEKKSDGHGQEEDEEGSGGESSGEDDEVETDDEDEEGMEEVMVPVADMLNAAYERDNVSTLSSR